MSVAVRSLQILDHFQQIPPLGIAQRRQQPIVNRQQIELREFGQEPTIGSVAATHGELVQQAGRSHVGGGEAVATGTLDEGRR